MSTSAYLLPTDFRVYVFADGGASRWPSGEAEECVLPTVNRFEGEPGGYVAVYSRDARGAVYSVGGGIYVVGQIRLRGTYDGRIFQPEGFEGRDISAAPELKALCNEVFGGGAWDCWAGGDTGGWFDR